MTTRTDNVVVPSENALTVFADGSCLSKPRRGGIGVHFVYTDSLGRETCWDLEESGYPGATINQMELMAVTRALSEIDSRNFDSDILAASNKIDVYTDSSYVVNNLLTAIYEWSQNKWMTRSGRPVANADLWKDLLRALRKVRQRKRVEIKWGRGHSKNNPHNKVADQLAKSAAKRPGNRKLSNVDVRRKLTSKKVQPGSVEMKGQRLTIRVVTAEYLTQKIHKYMYEVTSRNSPYYRNTDVIYSESILLRAAHTYYVKLNDDTKYPRIEKLYKEVKN